MPLPWGVPCGYDVKWCDSSLSTKDAPPPYYTPPVSGPPSVQKQVSRVNSGMNVHEIVSQNYRISLSSNRPSNSNHPSFKNRTSHTPLHIHSNHPLFTNRTHSICNGAVLNVVWGWFEQPWIHTTIWEAHSECNDASFNVWGSIGATRDTRYDLGGACSAQVMQPCRREISHIKKNAEPRTHERLCTCATSMQ